MVQIPLLIGPSGANGGAVTLVLVADDSLPSGSPVIISRANGHIQKADAAVKPKSFVIGLLGAASAAGFGATLVIDALTMSDWTAVTGSQLLAVGQPYFLGVGGGLTTTVPGAPNCLTRVGMAVTPNELLINPNPPIQQ